MQPGSHGVTLGCTAAYFIKVTHAFSSHLETTYANRARQAGLVQQVELLGAYHRLFINGTAMAAAKLLPPSACSGALGVLVVGHTILG